MVTTTRLRLLRLKYGIPLSEVAKQAGVSIQRINRLEFACVCSTPEQEQRVSKALGEVIAQRYSELAELEKDYLLSKGRLLEPLEVQDEL